MIFFPSIITEKSEVFSNSLPNIEVSASVDFISNIQFISPRGILDISSSFVDLPDALTVMNAIKKSTIKNDNPPINK